VNKTEGNWCSMTTHSLPGALTSGMYRVKITGWGYELYHNSAKKSLLKCNTHVSAIIQCILQNTSSRLWTELGNNRDGSSPVSTISIKEYTVNITITTYKLLSCPQLLMHRYHHPIKYRCMHRRSFGFQAHVTDPRHFAIWAIRSLDWSFVSSMKEKR
jgi:hypothetical protein